VSLSSDRLSTCSAGERSTQHLQGTAKHNRVVDCMRAVVTSKLEIDEEQLESPPVTSRKEVMPSALEC
jgi:hypothetical protein